MAQEDEILNVETLRAKLETKWLGREPNAVLQVWDTIDSTNKHALQLAKENAAQGTCIMSREQTAGRGRLGRSWVSPPDSGIYMSIILRPTLAMEDMPLITLATGVACAKAIQSVCGLAIGLKWVNDLIWERKKLGGILVEMQKPAVVVGIGINVQHDEETVPEDLKEKMTWLRRGSDTAFSTNTLAVTILFQLEEYYEMLLAGRKSDVLNDWRELSVNIGKEVSCQSGNQLLEGRVIGINEQGALLLQTTNGEQVIYAGEVSIRNLDGSYT